MPPPNRRRFLAASAATAAGLTALGAAGAARRPNERVRLAVMGVRGRGRDLIRGFSALPDVEIAYVCEVDESVVPAALKAVAARQKQAPRVERDVRRVLQDKAVTALVVAAPDHWHALATIWACQAGKHVYVEKPVSHNVVEGRKMVEAARRHNRVVQAGTQRRSAAHFASAREFVRSGKLGRVPFIRTWIAGNRPSIGRAKDGKPPRGVDYDLWLGPAPQRPFNPNRFHYKWHWHWDYGTGELGNNGIHALDMARFVAGLDTPHRISAGGGKYFYDDDQQTPDTHVAAFDFAHTCVIWEHRIWSRTGFEGQPWGLALYGERGTLLFTDKGWRVADGVQASDAGPAGGEVERAHLRNFLDCVRSGRRPSADIEEGHKSTRMCHLGNLALRLGRTLHFDAKTETCTGDAEANRMLRRAYRKPFTAAVLEGGK
jgi:predicted dehydrogenase